MANPETSSNRHAAGLWSVFLDLAERQPDVEAILAPGRSPLRFGDLPARIEAVRCELNRAGVGCGDLVATALPNGADTAVCLTALGCFATGAPLNPQYSEDEFDRYLKRIQPRALIVPEGGGQVARTVAASLGIPVVDLVADLRQACGGFSLRSGHVGSPARMGWGREDDVAFILQTSGSTGDARLVPLRQRILLNYAAATRTYYGLGPADRCIHVMPMFHGHGLKASLLNPLMSGGGVVCLDRFDVAAFFASLEAFHPTWFSAGFTIHRTIADGLEPFRAQARAAKLRFIRSGSGRLDPSVMRRLEEAFESPVVERYGMSETGTLAYNPLPPRMRKPGTVGVVGSNRVRTVDESGRTLAANEEGEVVASGPSVVDGYWDDPKATAEAFVDGWFHTGDLGRFDDDGYLTITGRIKDLINRGGEKISPAEVESVLLGHGAVAEACVFPVPHPTLGQEVVAAVVPRASHELDESVLLAFVRERLASFKVPRKVVRVNQLPRTASGKLQRDKMPQLLGPGGESAHRSERDGGGRTALETALGGLWASMLKRDAVDPDEDFFLLGGDSLSAIRLLGQVQEVFGAKLPLAAILDQASTVARMARCIEQSRKQVSRAELPTSRPDDDAAPIPRRDASVPCPVSFQQRRLWFLDRLHPGNSVYHLSSAISMAGPLNVEALARALNKVVERHEALRTTFSMIAGEPCQVVASSLDVPLPVRDLRDLPPAQREAETRGLLDEEVHRPFDMERGPLLRALLVKLADDDHTLLLVQHHIVTDAWSRGIFQRELSALYDAFAEGKDAQLPELPLQYSDYSAWQRRTLSGARLDEMLAYWRTRLAGAPTAVALPTDRRRKDQRDFAGSRLDRSVPGHLVEAFFELARKERTSPYFAWLAAFNAFLSRCSNETDIVVGVPVQGRDRPETLGVVGFFINMLPVRTDLSGDPSFRELLARVRKASAADLAHQHLPFERIVEDLQPGRRIGETPLFNTTCILLDETTRVVRPGWGRGISEFDRGTAPFDLSLGLNETSDDSRLSFRYNSALFEGRTIERMMSQFVRLLEGIVSAPDRPISEIVLLTPEERHQIVVTWNGTDAEYPGDSSLQALFEARTDASPGAIAVADGRRQLTYAQLDEESNRLAHLLRERGVGPNVVVGICLERSIDFVVATLAIVKAGGAYLPLDTKYPDSRRNFILANANTALLVTRSAIVEGGDPSTPPVIDLDEVAEDVARQPSVRPPVRASGDDLAYVIYTSGSTGQPKGVAVRQRGVSRLVINTNYLAFSPATVIGQASNVAFDAATFEIWGALLNGGRLEILDDETILRPDHLAAAIAERGVTAMFLTAALFHQAARSKPDAFEGLQTLLVGGDAADPTACGLVLEAGPPEHLINAYGPTEATTFASFHEVRIVPADATSIPIGRPIANTRLYVLGPHMQPEPVGIPGELYIGGPGVARGYVNLPELTSKRFLLDPFSDKPGAVLYRTGDRARYLADGTIEWLGRIDRQVKIRGFRVEPGEIEAALLRHPHVAEAAVEAVEGDGGARRLVGYVTRRSKESAADSELRAFLRQTVPDFMIPDSFVWLERLPLTPGGKVDRSALPHQPVTGRPGTIAPRTPTEQTVAAIWAEHLGLDSVGIEDDFFDLGGHSLLAVRLITALELKFTVSLPLALLFEAPTVSALARAIDDRRDIAGPTRVVTIQPLGRKTPIFALPGGGGSVIAYGLLSRALGRDQPFYGLEHPGLDDGEVPPDRVESVAAGFLEDMRREDPNRPCVLIGACSGAIVAFELARRLEAEGRRVDRVIMLDPSRIGSRRSPVETHSLWRRLVVPRFVASRLASYVREFRSLDGEARRRFVTSKRERLAKLVREPETLRESARDVNRDRVREATVAALYRYVPQPYGGPVALILGERFDSAAHQSGSLWRSVCSGPLEVLRMPGKTSGEMLRPPLLEHLVRHVRSLLG